MRYRLMVSYDCGCSYQCAQESDNPEDFAEKAKQFSKDWLRWVVESDDDAAPIAVSPIHQRIIQHLGSLKP